MNKMLNHQTAIWSSIKKIHPILFRDKLRYFQFETNNNISILHADKLRNVFQFEPTINISNITRR